MRLPDDGGGIEQPRLNCSSFPRNASGDEVAHEKNGFTCGACGFFAVAHLLFRFAHDRARLVRIDLTLAVLLLTVARVA